MRKQVEKKISQNEKQLRAGYEIAADNTIFGFFVYRQVRICGREKLGRKTAAISTADGTVFVNKDVALSPRQWAFAIAHCILHNCFGHYDLEKVPGFTEINYEGHKVKKARFNPKLWNIACDIYVDKFLSDIKLGEPIGDSPVGKIPQGVMKDELSIYEYLIQEDFNEDDHIYGVGAPDVMDMTGLDKPLEYKPDRWGRETRNDYAADFVSRIASSVRGTISYVAGHEGYRDSGTGRKAAEWFVSSFPLLGALAASFKIVEDTRYCQNNDIKIAAVNAWDGIIYINTYARLSDEEWKFVLAHEFLHAALMHHKRCEGREPYLWNIATDYVINGWLFEMRVGSMPADVLYDPELKDMSAEEIYDRINEDLKFYLKLDTFRGYGKGDILGRPVSGVKSAGVSLDEFYRNALSQGLEYEQARGRGFIPAGLVEEIRALAVPPIPWDVKLAEWFEVHIRSIEKYRSYAHPSRRQSSTPDIPRPRYAIRESDANARTFGVVLDTSGSMTGGDLGKALGAIASYAASKDVPAARVIFCDANAYDAGFMAPEDIAGRVKVVGRGGTRLQPGIDLLQRAEDFPNDGPILIISDGEIEQHLNIKNEHAFLLPVGCRLPFKARGDVFYFD